jgi:DNA-binding beta-propeller fold protein YncE
LLFLATCSQKPAPLPPKPPLEFIGEWGARGEGPGKLRLPLSMATDATGLVYIADAGSGFVHKFDPLGGPLLSFAPEGMRRATGIAVDLGGAIYVADYAQEKVLVFFPDGSKLREMRGSPRRPFRGPVGVAVDG